MKIHAIAQPPSVPSYLHIGYLASPTPGYSARYPMLGAGTLLLCFGIAVSIIRVRRTRMSVKSTEMPAKKPSLLQRNVGMAFICCVLGGALILIAAGAISQEKATQRRINGINDMRMFSFWQAVPHHPELLGLSFDELIAHEDMKRSDVWGNPMWLTNSPKGVVFHSLGPDGIRDTEDDIHYPASEGEDWDTYRHRMMKNGPLR
jgi:hypothetical protein